MRNTKVVVVLITIIVFISSLPGLCLDSYADTGRSIKERLEGANRIISVSNYSNLLSSALLMAPISLRSLNVDLAENPVLFYSTRISGNVMMLSGIPISNLMVNDRLDSVIADLKKVEDNQEVVGMLMNAKTSIAFSNYAHFAGIIILGTSLLYGIDSELTKTSLAILGGGILLAGVPIIRFGASNRIKEAVIYTTLKAGKNPPLRGN